MKFLQLTVSGLIFCTSAWGATPQQQAFSDAQTLAAGAQAGAVANVAGGGVAATVKQFNPTYYNTSGTSPEAALFQGGNGNPIGAGRTKANDCQTGAPNPDSFLQQNCDAINTMARIPQIRPTIAIPPSMFATSKNILANAPQLAASAVGSTGTGGFSGCTNKTVLPPPTTQTCNVFTGTPAQQCTVGQVVLVDAFHNYQCDKTNDIYSSQACTKTLLPTVTTKAACNISGTIYVDAMPGQPAYSIDSFGRPLSSMINSQYTLQFSCEMSGVTPTGRGLVKFAPTAIFNTGSYNQGTTWWIPGTWGIYGYGPTTISFTPGVAQFYGPYDQADGSGWGSVLPGMHSYLYYDGTNWYVQETHLSLLFYAWRLPSDVGVPEYSFCAPGYVMEENASFAAPNQCRLSGTSWSVPNTGLQDNCAHVGGSLITKNSNVCIYWVNGFKKTALAIKNCAKGDVFYKKHGPDYCFTPDNAPQYYLPPLGPASNTNPPIDNGIRHFKKANGTYTGFVGLQYTLNDTLNDTCGTFQSQTSTPTAVPATTINGQLVCPVGKTLSGINCL